MTLHIYETYTQKTKKPYRYAHIKIECTNAKIRKNNNLKLNKKKQLTREISVRENNMDAFIQIKKRKEKKIKLTKTDDISRFVAEMVFTYGCLFPLIKAHKKHTKRESNFIALRKQ